jgi:hypothetical protein
MFTSNFARSKTFPDGDKPVSIARKSPWYFRGESFLELAPTEAMLEMPIADYVADFDAILARLDPRKVFEAIGDTSILLCWESPGVFCHRRAVAQWLEQSLDISVPEFGFDRESFPTYPVMALKGTAEARKLSKSFH